MTTIEETSAQQSSWEAGANALFAIPGCKSFCMCINAFSTPKNLIIEFHYEQLPVDGVVDLIQQCAGRWHPGVFDDRIPARLLVLEPLPYACAVGRSSRGGDVVRKAAQPLAQRTHP
jgi:hypothetical protein